MAYRATYKTLYDQNRSFWEDYEKSRVKVPASFFDTLCTYHSDHGGSFRTLNDIGAGVGWIARNLSDKFERIILTDPAATTLDTARDLLGKDSHFEFVNAQGEADTQPEASVDFVVVCNAHQYMPPKQFLDRAWKQLRPRGTLCVAFWALPRFQTAEADRAWFAMIDDLERCAENRLGADAVKGVLTIQDNNTEYLALPKEHFEAGVRRIRINWTHDGLDFKNAPDASRRLDVAQHSGVGPDDRVEEQSWKEWRSNLSSDEIKTLVKSYPFKPEEELLQRHLAVFRDLVGSEPDGRFTVYWPVSITLAIRK